nr:uncharacterized protein LOC130540579 [Pan paniscus]
MAGQHKPLMGPPYEVTTEPQIGLIHSAQQERLLPFTHFQPPECPDPRPPTTKEVLCRRCDVSYLDLCTEFTWSPRYCKPLLLALLRVRVYSSQRVGPDLPSLRLPQRGIGMRLPWAESNGC